MWCTIKDSKTNKSSSIDIDFNEWRNAMFLSEYLLEFLFYRTKSRNGNSTTFTCTRRVSWTLCKDYVIVLAGYRNVFCNVSFGVLNIKLALRCSLRSHSRKLSNILNIYKWFPTINEINRAKVISQWILYWKNILNNEQRNLIV